MARSERGRFGRFVLILLWVLGVVQVPLLVFLHVATGVSWWILGLVFVGANAPMVLRVWFLPRPDPPPVWFERYVIWGFFGLAVLCLWFTPGALALWLLALPLSAGWAWLAASAALAALAVGVPARWVRVRRLDVPIPSLPSAFDGVTIAQLTDLHVGPFVSRRRIRRWVALANELRPDFVFLTGDLIATGERFIEPLEDALAELRPVVATYAVMGNHDYFGHAGDAMIAMFERLDVQLLRNESRVVRREGAEIVIAGVDDSWRRLDDLDAALAGVRPTETPVLLLAHDPALFPKAAARGVALQVSGHIHGGQLAIPFLGRRGAVLRLFSMPWIYGLYRQGRSQLYLGAGLGTTGAPIRVGMPSEVALLRLRPAEPPGLSP